MNFLEKTFSLKNKISLVTGAYEGNGRSIALALGRAGSELILLDKNTRLKTLSKKLQNENIKSKMYICDLEDEEKLKITIKKILNENKKINIIVNNAAVTFSGNLSEYSEELWNKTYKINLLAPFLISKLISKNMKIKKGGSIINITSLNAELGFPNNPAYISFKGALKQLTKSLAYDLGKYDIRCNNIGPGYFKTNMTKSSWNNLEKRNHIKKRTVLNRWGVSDDLVGIIIFLASDSSSYITGQDFYVDGGWLIKGM